MSVTQKDGFFLKARITGPRYAFLGLRFALGTELVTMPTVEVLPNSGRSIDANGLVDSHVVRASVQAEVERGVAEANRGNGAHFRVAAIRVVAGDNLPHSTYGYIAQQIIEYVLDDRNQVRVGGYTGQSSFMEASSLYPCPCCGQLTLTEPPPGTYDICALCGWEDDNVQFDDIDYGGGANKVSLRQARENYQKLGTSDPQK